MAYSVFDWDRVGDVVVEFEAGFSVVEEEGDEVDDGLGDSSFFKLCRSCWVTVLGKAPSTSRNSTEVTLLFLQARWILLVR